MRMCPHVFTWSFPQLQVTAILLESAAYQGVFETIGGQHTSLLAGMLCWHG